MRRSLRPSCWPVAAAAAVIPLASPPPAAADSVVIGGHPVEISERPGRWRCPAVTGSGVRGRGSSAAVWWSAATTVLTAAHCLGEDVLGAPPERVRD